MRHYGKPRRISRFHFSNCYDWTPHKKQLTRRTSFRSQFHDGWGPLWGGGNLWHSWHFPKDQEGGDGWRKRDREGKEKAAGKEEGEKEELRPPCNIMIHPPLTLVAHPPRPTSKKSLCFCKRPPAGDQSFQHLSLWGISHANPSRVYSWDGWITKNFLRPVNFPVTFHYRQLLCFLICHEIMLLTARMVPQVGWSSSEIKTWGKSL